jgi:hypothetical protein
MAVGVNVTGASNEAGLEAAARSIGLMPTDMPAGTTSAVGQWQMAAVAVELAELAVESRFEGIGVSVLAFGVETL